MPKNNNLQDYLKDLYEGIASRKADASKNPQDFRQEIENLVFTGDADAIAADIRLNKTAYVNDIKIAGTIEDYDGSILVDGQPQILDYSELTLLRIEEICNEGTKPAEILYPLSGVRIYLDENSVYQGDSMKNYVYRFYFYSPTARDVSIIASRSYEDLLDECTWALGKLNTVVPTTTSSHHVNQWTAEEKAHFQTIIGAIPDNTILTKYAVEPGVYFVDIKFVDSHNTIDKDKIFIGLSQL